MRDDVLTDKITRVTFGRGSIQEGADVTKYINDLESKLETVLDGVRPLVRAARSWHDFHHGSKDIQCDAICDALKAAEVVVVERHEHKWVTDNFGPTKCELCGQTSE